MTSQNILRPVSANSRKVKSPPRKRARYESLCKGRWSLNSSDVVLDEIQDCGLGILESDTEEENVENEPVNTHSSTERKQEVALLQSTLSKESLKKVSLNEWDDCCIQKQAPQPEVKGINYFNCLSDEVILHIFHNLPKRFLTSVALVCQRWHRLTQDESLWARMDVSNKNLQAGSVGQIFSRQVVILRLAQSEIAYPPFLPGCRAFLPEFKSRLLYLDLSMAHTTCDALVDIFKRCRRLKKVSLEHVLVNKDVISSLAYSTELEVLNLALTQGIDLEGLKYLLTNCNKLRELNISWTSLSVASLGYLCSHLPDTLDRLNISGCRKLLTDKHVLDIVSCCQSLRELDLSDSTGLTGEVIQHLLLLEELNFLALSRCYQIPFKALLILKKIPSLMYLDVHGGYIESTELMMIQEGLGSRVNINKFKFSSVARPTVGAKHSSIWNLRVRDC